jgi:sRNA-binding regulator protein Hfq
MGHLRGLNEYLEEQYARTVFDTASQSGEPWELQLHESKVITATIVRNLKYDLEIRSSDTSEEILPKVNVKFLYPTAAGEQVRSLIKIDKAVKALNLEPIASPRERYHIKNKSLYPLMHERKVVFFTLLEGEIVKGIVAGFSRYEISVNLKGGQPITILRHAVYDLRDKRGRCFLKEFQETHRDWRKSELYVS